MTESRSAWQPRIEGVWYGMPGIFDADGRHVGYGRIARAITRDEAGHPTFYVRQDLELQGPLRERLRSIELVMHVRERGASRVYVGRDFYGMGLPYGPTLIGGDYLQPWACDTRVIVQLLAGGKTQAYSLLFSEGPVLLGAFVGGYALAHDYEHSRETRAAIDAFLAHERSIGAHPFSAAFARPGRWTGHVEAFGAGQAPLGRGELTITQRPRGEDEADLTVMVGGALSGAWRISCRRQGSRYFFEGPDLYGNGAALGRALFTTRYVHGQALKIEGREMLLDERGTLGVVWQLFRDEHALEAVISGSLEWEAGL